MKKKAYAVFCVLVLLFCAAGTSIAGASGSAEYVAAAEGQSLYRLDVGTSRGMIYDCQLTPLVCAKGRRVAAVAPAIETVGALEKATDGEYRDRLAAALRDGKPFLLETEGVPYSALQDPEIDLFSVPVRYEDDQLAPHVIGYLDGLGNGASGIELAMDDVLGARSGEAYVLYQADALGRVLAGADRQVENTLNRSKGGVALTLDARIQQLAQEAGQRLEKGAVVVTEVPNCEVRAMASFPDFSPLDLAGAQERGDGALLNRALCAYAPGSVFKLVPAAVELENGGGQTLFTCTGSLNSGGLLFHCYGGIPHGEVNLTGALEKSCNCYFISSARSLGGQSILNMAYNLGLGASQEFGRGLFTAAGTLPEAGALQNVRTLANFAFGQGETTVTPLQLCGLVNAVASGGMYSSPKLILGTVDSELTLTPSHPVTDKSLRAMSIGTALVLQNAMRGAAKEGTARPGAPENCRVGVKTGTAQTGIFENGEELLHFWYCGFAEDENGPRYCVTVFRESTPDDGGATAEVFREIAEGLGELIKEDGE